MKQRVLDVLSKLALVVTFGLAAALAMPRVSFAEMIPSDAMAQQERARVKSMLERPEIQREMEKMGVPPEKAAQRVDAMTDEEVAQLAGRLDSLPAGAAAFTNEQLLLIIIIVLLIVIIL